MSYVNYPLTHGDYKSFPIIFCTRDVFFVLITIMVPTVRRVKGNTIFVIQLHLKDLEKL